MNMRDFNNKNDYFQHQINLETVRVALKKKRLECYETLNVQKSANKVKIEILQSEQKINRLKIKQLKEK